MRRSTSIRFKSTGYDPRRVKHEKPRQGYQSWDVNNYLAETDDQDEIQAIYTNEPQPYGNLISQYRKGPTIWTPSYYHYDALGSARALSDDVGDATDTYVYDAWGNEVAISGSTLNPFRWGGRVGYYFNDETGTFYIRAQVYEPVTGRWMSRDPLFRRPTFYPIELRGRACKYFTESSLPQEGCGCNCPDIAL